MDLYLEHIQSEMRDWIQNKPEFRALLPRGNLSKVAILNMASISPLLLNLSGLPDRMLTDKLTVILKLARSPDVDIQWVSDRHSEGFYGIDRIMAVLRDTRVAGGFTQKDLDRLKRLCSEKLLDMLFDWPKDNEITARLWPTEFHSRSPDDQRESLFAEGDSLGTGLAYEIRRLDWDEMDYGQLIRQTMLTFGRPDEDLCVAEKFRAWLACIWISPASKGARCSLSIRELFIMSISIQDTLAEMREDLDSPDRAIIIQRVELYWDICLSITTGVHKGIEAYLATGQHRLETFKHSIIMGWRRLIERHLEYAHELYHKLPAAQQNSPSFWQTLEDAIERVQNPEAKAFLIALLENRVLVE